VALLISALLLAWAYIDVVVPNYSHYPMIASMPMNDGFEDGQNVGLIVPMTMTRSMWPNFNTALDCPWK